MDPEALRWTPVMSGPPSLNVSPLKNEGVENHPKPSEENGGKRRKGRRGLEPNSIHHADEVDNDKAVRSKMKLVKKKLLNKLKKSKAEMEEDDDGIKISASSEAVEAKEPKAGVTSDDEIDAGKSLERGRLRKRSAKRSGEFKGLDGGSNNNISTEQEQEAHQDTEDVTQTNGKLKSKKQFAAKNSSEPKKRNASGKNILKSDRDDRQFEAANDADVEDEADDKVSIGKNEVKAEPVSHDQELDSGENSALSSRTRMCRGKSKANKATLTEEKPKRLCKKDIAKTVPQEDLKVKTQVIQPSHHLSLKVEANASKKPVSKEQATESTRKFETPDKVEAKTEPEPTKMVVKKAIILPILSRHHKEAMLKAKLAAVADKPDEPVGAGQENPKIGSSQVSTGQTQE